MEQVILIGPKGEFEAEVERRKGENDCGLVMEDFDKKFTHITDSGKKCSVLYEDEHSQLIEYVDGARCCNFIKRNFATKRKPTISKADAWDKIAEYNGSAYELREAFTDILEQYEVK